MDKQLRNKIRIAVICIVVLTAVLIINSIAGGDEDDKSSISDEIDYQQAETELQMYDRIDRSEAYYLFSLLLTDTGEAEHNEVLDGAKILFKHDLINKDDLDNSQVTLNCVEFADIYYNLTVRLNLDYNNLISDLPTRLADAFENDAVYISDFLIMYERMMNVLGYRTEDIMIAYADKEAVFDEKFNRYEWENVKDYSSFFSDSDDINDGKSPLNTLQESINASDYMFMSIEAVIIKERLIYIRGKSKGTFVIPNIWIEEGRDKDIYVFANGNHITYTLEHILNEDITKSVADVIIDRGAISKLKIKQSVINGKVLLADERGIELLEYGRIEFDDNLRIYSIYDGLEAEQSTAILVGYSITDFIISEGKICAAVIKESLKADKIRVIINTTDYNGLYHEQVELTVDGGYSVIYNDKETVHEAAEIIKLTCSKQDMMEGRIIIRPDSEKSRIKLLSIERSYGNPEYRGNIEIREDEKGLVIINEVSIEEYLYSVIPSEMPVSYGNEALMVQAVCARSYACNQINSARYRYLGAHVDDSVNCQVYNNIEENEKSIKAVKDSYGKVMTYNGNVISSFYFSTSCGITANIDDVWQGSEVKECFQSTIQSPETEGKKAVLSSENDFRRFIDEEHVKLREEGESVKLESIYDRDFSWYRWKITYDSETLCDRINNMLEQMVWSTNEGILLKLKSGEFISRQVKTIGKLKNITVLRRAESGIITELIIEGSENTIKLLYQTRVREFLAPREEKLIRNDGSIITSMKLLPSAFCYIDRQEKNGKISFQIKGGGYGHGVGMSQNGVKKMAELGYSYEDIIKHFYTDIELDFIYG